VADDRANAWTCPTALFARQMTWLKRNVDVVSLSEAQERIRSGNPRRAVAVTFDDGYADNNDFALPLLVARADPLHLFRDAPSRAATACRFRTTCGWGTRSDRIRWKIWRIWSELGIEIGAHTRTHPDCGKIDDKARLYGRSRHDGRGDPQAIGKTVRHFAFPFACREHATARLRDGLRSRLRKESARPTAPHFPGDDRSTCNASTPTTTCCGSRNWLTVDPRSATCRDTSIRCRACLVR